MSGLRGTRRFSQAISEGDGISLVAEVAGADDARLAEAGGAEALVVRSGAPPLGDVTALPVLWCVGTNLDAARGAGADAFLLTLEGLEDDDGRLEAAYGAAVEAGLDCVVAVRDEDELRLALDRLDPEIVLLSARARDDGGLEHVLSLLPDVPAGKLAVAALAVPDREDVAELERAGVDGVVVRATAVAGLLSSAPQAS